MLLNFDMFANLTFLHAFECAFSASWSHLGPSWSRLEAILESSESNLGTVSETSVRQYAGCWTSASRLDEVSFLSCLNCSWKLYVAILQPYASILGHMRPSRPSACHLGAIMESWSHFGEVWGDSGLVIFEESLKCLWGICQVFNSYTKLFSKLLPWCQRLEFI